MNRLGARGRTGKIRLQVEYTSMTSGSLPYRQTDRFRLIDGNGPFLNFTFEG